MDLVSSSHCKPTHAWSPKFTAPPSSPVESIHVDPDDLLSASVKAAAAFISLLKEFQVVFNPESLVLMELLVQLKDL